MLLIQCYNYQCPHNEVDEAGLGNCLLSDEDPYFVLYIDQDGTCTGQYEDAACREGRKDA